MSTEDQTPTASNEELIGAAEVLCRVARESRPQIRRDRDDVGKRMDEELLRMADMCAGILEAAPARRAEVLAQLAADFQPSLSSVRRAADELPLSDSERIGLTLVIRLHDPAWPKKRSAQ